MRLRKARSMPPQIPTCSMADIAFLLIIFYMVGTKFQVDKQQVRLPATRIRGEILAESAFVSITEPTGNASVGVNGSVVRYSEGREISQPVVDVDDLQQRVAVTVSKEFEKFFVIKADVEVPYETLDLVMASLRDAGARNVTFLSTKKV